MVRDLHSCPVRSLAWSTNGMKLYSGDTKGSVGCMEVDFYEVTAPNHQNTFYHIHIFSSPERLGSQGELIVYPLSRRLSVVRPSS